jgi:hypothetical protein
MTTQVQIRGTTEPSQQARTLVSRELDINTTDWRLAIHNGSTPGGIRHVNCYDQQNSEFNYGAVSGTNALTVSMRVAPIGYQAGAVYFIKIASNNTGSVTININSLGAKSIRKMKNGVLSNLDANDLITGAIVQIVYDGTLFQVIGISNNTDRTAWTPTNVSSFVANDCVYVDLDYAVIVSYNVVTEFNFSFSHIIGNLPFDAETKTYFPIRLSYASENYYAKDGITEIYINQAANVLNFSIPAGVGSNLTLQGTATYIKD